ncbi:MAG: hypothetical protein JWN31_1011, partial [Frankiales bacterium]|nr:hypothetical protein [Frankiales bacterium]
MLVVVWFLNLLRWARSTRPEPLPPPPTGSTEVLTRDGTRLYAQVGGDESGELTMVFVHGFLARSISFDMQWHHFSRSARVIRYDHRNHGRSEHSMAALNIETLASDLMDVIGQLAPTGRLVLVGQSMGGMTVMALAARHPELFENRVAGVALVATGAGDFIDGHPWENRFRWASRHRLLAPGLLLLRLLAPALEQIRPRRTHVMRVATRKLVFGTQDVDPALLAMTQQLLEEPPLSSMASLQGSLLRNDVIRPLRELKDMPVLVLTGKDDRLIRPEHARRLVEHLGADAELVVVPGAG